MNAKRIVEMLVDDPKRKPYWEREAEQRHQDELERIRGIYGQDKTEPNERQAKLIGLYWRRGEPRKALDYCRAHGLNPNHVIAKLPPVGESQRGELPFGDLVPVGEWEGRLVYHGCSQQDAQSIMKGIEVRPTGGYFGNAFYVADDPKLAKSNYADFADEDAGGAAILEFTIKPGAHILDLRNDEDTEEWGRVTHRGNDISRSDFHIQMVRQGIDGVFDRSVGGLAVYNPEVLDLKGPWRG